MMIARRTAIAALPRRRTALIALIGALCMLDGCSAIRPLFEPPPARNYYALSYTTVTVNAAVAMQTATNRLPTLIVSPPQAAAGFDSRRMMYMRKPDQLEYFAYNEWVDTPARMLAPLIVSAVADSGAFRAVLQTPSPAAGELRLETELLRLQQEFLRPPGQLHLTLRATLIDNATRRVLATRDFEAMIGVTGENPARGVVAANQAVQNVLQQLSAFCAETARPVTAGAPVTP